MYAYAHALDSGNADGAGAHLDRALEILPSLPRSFGLTCLVESAYFEARIASA